MAALNSENVSKITEGEKKITMTENIPKNGPTAQAQSHATKGDRLDGSTVADISRAEQRLTGADGPVAGGPTAQAQSIASEGVR
jgi:hypothetical protein